MLCIIISLMKVLGLFRGGSKGSIFSHTGWRKNILIIRISHPCQRECPVISGRCALKLFQIVHPCLPNSLRLLMQVHLWSKCLQFSFISLCWVTIEVGSKQNQLIRVCMKTVSYSTLDPISFHLASLPFLSRQNSTYSHQYMYLHISIYLLPHSWFSLNYLLHSPFLLCHLLH